MVFIRNKNHLLTLSFNPQSFLDGFFAFDLFILPGFFWFHNRNRKCTLLCLLSRNLLKKEYHKTSWQTSQILKREKAATFSKFKSRQRDTI